MTAKSNVVNINISPNGDLSTDQVQLPDLSALRTLLKAEVLKNPQLEAHIHVTELDSYEIVGKVIYQTQIVEIKTVKCFGGEFLP